MAKTSKKSLIFLVLIICLSLLYHLSIYNGQTFPFIFGDTEPNIFFLETSGTGLLQIKHAASIEAAALWNPRKTIFVYIFSGKPNSTPSILYLLQNKYRNIVVFQKSLDEFAKDSELEGWFNEGAWKNSVAPISHISDAFRFLTLKRFGGIYMDLDIITLKKFSFSDNALFYAYKGMIGSGFLAFRKNHTLISACLKQLVQEYKPKIYGANGPILVTAQYKQYSQMKGNPSDVKVYPSQEVCPVPWWDSKIYFDNQLTYKALSLTVNSSAVHWFSGGGTGKGKRLAANSTCAFMMLVKTNSPIVYAEIQKLKFV